MKIRLVKATAKNFLIYRELSLDLDDQGLVFLSGTTPASTTLDSNGSGKSSLLSLISWIIWGQPLKSIENAASIIHFGTDVCEGKLEGFIDDEPFWIERVRTRKGIDVNASFTGSSRGREIQEEINNVFGTLQTAQNTFMLGQGRALEFLSARDAHRKDMLLDLLRALSYRKAQEKIKADIKDTTRAIEMLNKDKKILEMKIEMHKQQALMNTKVKLAELEAKKATLEDHLKKITVGVEHLDGAVTRASGVCKLASQKYYKAKNELSNLQTQYDIKVVETESYPISVKTLSAQLEGRCYVCGSMVDTPEAKRQQIMALIEEQQLELKKLYNLQEAITTETMLVAKLKEDEELANQELAFLHKNRSNLFNEKTALHESIEVVENNIKAVNTLEHCNEVMEQLHKDLEALGKTVEESTYSLKILQYLDKAFGNTGIPAILADEALPIINHYLFQYLEAMTDGELTACLVMEEDKITISVGDRGKELSLEACSEGQKRRVVVALFLALAKTQEQIAGSVWNILLVDELFDILDQPGIEKVLSVLRELSTKTIVISSHRNEILNSPSIEFNKNWKVVRTDDTSHLES